MRAPRGRPNDCGLGDVCTGITPGFKAVIEGIGGGPMGAPLLLLLLLSTPVGPRFKLGGKLLTIDVGGGGIGDELTEHIEPWDEPNPPTGLVNGVKRE